MKTSLSKWWQQIFFAITLAVLSTSAAIGAPSIFTSTSMDEARAQAQKEKKILLVDFTATWCGPCHQMDETTWEAKKVQDWVKENAIAVQVDVDEDKKTASELQIEGMPTIVIFTPKDYSYEFDRKLGYQSEEQMNGWFDQIKNGLRSMESLKARYAAATGKGGQREAEARYDLAKTQVLTQQYAMAIEHYVWLWTNVDKEYPAMSEVKNTTMADDIAKLCAAYPPAKKRFEDLKRDAEANGQNTDAFKRILGDGSASAASSPGPDDAPTSSELGFLSHPKFLMFAIGIPLMLISAIALVVMMVKKKRK